MSYILRPKFTSGFEVEWVYNYGEQTPGDFNPDLVQYAHRDFADRAGAEAFIERLLPTTFDGEARLTAYHLEEYEAGTGVYFKTYDGGTEFINSED
jgi:hypothetical protein